MDISDIGKNINLNNLTSSSQYYSRLNEGGFNQIGSKLSVHSIDMRYEDNIACCLPPPSPAPNCDRFIMNIPSPSNSVSSHFTDSQLSSLNISNNHQQTMQHIQHQTGSSTSHKYSNGLSNTLQRSISPNSRFRMSERFREISPKCERFLASTHFLTNSSPLVSNDAYSYLSSTVHTPVKRYVPTPPPSSEIYSDISQHLTTTSSTPSTSSTYHTVAKSPNLPHQQLQLQSSSQQSHNSQHHSNISTLPYRFRMKCCISDQAVSSNLSSLNQSTQQCTPMDHCSTLPIRTGVKCSANNDTLSIEPSSQRLSANNYQQQINSTTQVNVRAARNTACTSNEYVSRTPSFEYIGSHVGRAATPVSVLSESNEGACLHCNTTRRTTGVHQTTQTTGPISPIPLQNLLENLELPESALSNEHTSSTSTPSTSESHISPLSPSMHKQQQVLKPNEDSICTEESKNSHNSKKIQKHQEPQEKPQFQDHHDTAHDLLHHDQQRHYLQQSQRYHNRLQEQVQQYHLHQPMQDRRQIVTSGNMTTAAINSRQQLQHRFSRKQRLNQYIRREVAKFFGVDSQSENDERIKWLGRQRRFAIRRFGSLKTEIELNNSGGRRQNNLQPPPTERPDILPIQSEELQLHSRMNALDFVHGQHVERKSGVPTMIFDGISYIVQTLNKRYHRNQRQWSRSFAPAHVTAINGDNPSDICEGLTTLQEEDVFFDSPGNDTNSLNASNCRSSHAKVFEHQRQIYMGERIHGWRTSAIIDNIQQHQVNGCNSGNSNGVGNILTIQQQVGSRGTRISSQIIDGVLENSRRPTAHKVKLFSVQDLDDRNDHRPFFTYWINTVQILVLTLSLICYGIGPVGFGVEQKTGQVLVTSLSLQTVQHHEQRNVWIGPRNSDLVHMGAKFASCMRRDMKIMNVISKTRRQERETACCIRNDDSGCVQSSQADCSVRGLFPTKSISTWKKWSPGESGPGGRISGSVCGLDPKFCDAPASIAPYEWPDDITKWPICRKTNSFSQRFRFKDHTAEHMVCEVIGHPCCTGIFGECRITTKEYCDFVNGYFHEEASLCSQISCLHNVCGMFPFFSIEIPDQFYRLFTSLCLHAGILHLAITVAFQHIFLSDLERLIGSIRTAILYIGSGLAGNLTSAVLVPYKPEVGPLASLAGVIASLVVLLLLMHWKQLRKPHIALLKLIIIAGLLFGVGTLPWQLNFAGLMAGILCGIFLTIALVPFVSVTRYGRKTKINLIWTCALFHLLMYAMMLVIFYLFPTELTSLNLGDVIGGNLNSNNGNIDGFRNLHMIPSNIHHQQQQHHHHHHSDSILSNTVLNRLTKNDNGMHLLQSQQRTFSSKTNKSTHDEYIRSNNNKLQIMLLRKICNDTYKFHYQPLEQQIGLSELSLTSVTQTNSSKENAKNRNRSVSAYFNEVIAKNEQVKIIRFSKKAVDINSFKLPTTAAVSAYPSPRSPLSSTTERNNGLTFKNREFFKSLKPR